MTRGNWQAGLSRLATTVITLQGIALACLLGLTWELLNSDGWFQSAHRRELLWDDAAVVIGLICLVPLVAFTLLRRSSGVYASVVITIITALVLVSMRPT